MLSKSLIQFSFDGQGCVPSLLLDLRPNYSGGNEDNDNLLQNVPCMHCCTQHPRPCSRPLLTHVSTGNCWTLMGMSGSVSCGVIAPFSWVLVCTSFCLCPPRVCFPQPSVNSGSPMVGLRLTSSKRAYAIPRSTAPCSSPCCSRAPAPAAVRADPYLCRRHSNTVLAQSFWGLWVLVHTRFF